MGMYLYHRYLFSIIELGQVYFWISLPFLLFTVAEASSSSIRIKGVDKGGARGASAPPLF